MTVRFQAAFILAAIISGSNIRAAPPDSLESLVADSPFGKPATAASASAETGGAIEFRGVFSERGEYFFSIYEVSARRAAWVGLREPGNPFIVQAYDQAKGTIEVEYQGQKLTVDLKRARVAALPAVAQPAAPVPGSGVATAGPAVAAAPVSDEATRLTQIAEEIRRRRAMRTQALQTNGNAAPAPKPITP